MSAPRALHPVGFVAALLASCGTNRVEVIERLDVAAVSTSSAPDAPMPPASASAVPSSVSTVEDAGVGSLAAPLATDTGPCGPPGLVSEPRYRLTLRSNGSCMGVGAATTSEGRPAFASAVAADCGVHYLWQLVQVPGGYYEIRNLTTGLSLETFNGLGTVGTDLVLMTPESELAQHFEIGALADEYFSITSRVGAGHCVTESYTGKAELIACETTDEAQQWRFEAQACVESDTLGDAGP